MNTIHIYRVQEEQLIELERFLERFKIEIQQAMDDYRRQVEHMYESGLPQETYMKFQVDHIDLVNGLVQNIVDQIESSSVPFIKNNTSYLLIYFLWQRCTA